MIMAKRKSRFTVSRRRAIIDRIKEEGEVLITDLSKRFDVSEVTIRNDLEFLEKKNLVMRARGGAINIESGVGIDPSITDKSKLHSPEKVAIGRRAAKLINENEIIILDSGTTTAEIAKNLDGFKSVTIITNALNIVNLLVGKPNINLIVPGGVLRQNSLSMVGPIAEKSLKSFFVDKAFISADGCDTKQGLFTPNIEEASLNAIMIEIAKEVILVADSSKFSRRSLVLFCGLDRIKMVVTDRGIPGDDQRRLEDAGILVVIT